MSLIISNISKTASIISILIHGSASQKKTKQNWACQPCIKNQTVSTNYTPPPVNKKGVTKKCGRQPGSPRAAGSPREPRRPRK